MKDFIDEPHARGSMARRSMWGRVKASALVAVVSALPMGSYAACQVQSLELPVKMVGSRAVATLGINGTPVPLVVDSGAFFSSLTDAAAEQLKLRLRRDPALRAEGLTGRVDVQTTTVEKLQLLKGELPGVQFMVGGNEPGAGTMGLIGRNILSASDTEYDLGHGVIRFLFPNDDCARSNMAYWAGSSPVTAIDLVIDYRSKVPAIRAPVKLNGTELVALFDTGARTIVTTRTARRAGVAETDWKAAGLLYGAGRGTTESWTADFEKFEIGGEVIRGNRLHVADLELGDANMLLGIDFFLSHRIYVSKKQSKMFFTYNGGTVFALDRAEAPNGPVPGIDPAASDGRAATADELSRRASASAARQDYQIALADLDRACALESTSAPLFAQRGGLHVALKHPDKALEDFDRALALDPTDVDARGQRASLRFASNDRDGATADLDALDRALPPQAQMRFPMSQLRQALGQYAPALVELNQWLAAHPREVTRPQALNSRCWARAMLGIELDQALDDCDEAIDGDRGNANYRDSRGWVYLRLGRYDKALADFDRGLADRPGIASSLYGRGIAKARLGDAAQADVDLAAARKAQPDIEQRTPRIDATVAPVPKR